MELMNVKNFANIADIAAKKEIMPMGWFDFSSWVSDIWFQGNLTWDQMSFIKDWAWKVKDHKDADIVFGTIKYAWDNHEFAY